MKEFNWYIARSENGFLYLFQRKPFRIGGLWSDGTPNRLFLKEHQYPEVTFSNSPVKVDAILLNPDAEPVNTLQIDFSIQPSIHADTV